MPKYDEYPIGMTESVFQLFANSREIFKAWKPVKKITFPALLKLLYYVYDDLAFPITTPKLVATFPNHWDPNTQTYVIDQPSPLRHLCNETDKYEAINAAFVDILIESDVDPTDPVYAAALRMLAQRQLTPNEEYLIKTFWFKYSTITQLGLKACK